MGNTNKIRKTQPSNNKPDRFAFIIGAMKSGTTSLFDILGQHPQVCPSKKKEPGYFTKDSNDHSHKSYLSLWDWQNNKHSIALESTVAYTNEPYITGVPNRIHNAGLGKYRFIYILRDPLTRIESQVRHSLFAGWGKPLDKGLPEDAIYFSSYAMQLDKYLEFFSREDIFLITLEEFKNNPHKVLFRICQFLEIDKDFKFKYVTTRRNSGEFFNASAGIMHLTQGHFGQFLAQKVLPKAVKNFLRNLITHLNKGKNKKSNLGRWQLTSGERRIILNRLEGDLQRLQDEFGVDIHKHWHI